MVSQDYNGTDHGVNGKSTFVNYFIIIIIIIIIKSLFIDNPEKYSSMFCFQHKIQRTKSRKNIESCEPRTNYELILS
jgi:hypothetical protein